MIKNAPIIIQKFYVQKFHFAHGRNFNVSETRNLTYNIETIIKYAYIHDELIL